MRPVSVSTSTSAKWAQNELMIASTLPDVTLDCVTRSSVMRDAASLRSLDPYCSASWRRASSAACLTAVPEVIVVAEPAVVWAGGVVAVSASTTSTRSVSMPSVSATICASTVSEPLPTSTTPMRTTARPAAVTWSSQDAETLPPPL